MTNHVCGFVPLDIFILLKTNGTLEREKKFKEQIQSEDVCRRGKLRPIDNSAFWLFWATPFFFLSTSCQRLSPSPSNYLFVSLHPIWSLQQESPPNSDPEFGCTFEDCKTVSEFRNFEGELGGVKQIADVNYQYSSQIPDNKALYHSLVCMLLLFHRPTLFNKVAH